MRHLSSFFKSLLNSATAAFRRDGGAVTQHAGALDPDTPIDSLKQRDAESNDVRSGAAIPAGPDLVHTTNAGSPKWWGNVAAWGIHGNEEFTKWWNHWMSRIPHAGSGLSPNRARKNDV